jgi:hypothetical protein
MARRRWVVATGLVLLAASGPGAAAETPHHFTYLAGDPYGHDVVRDLAGEVATKVTGQETDLEGDVVLHPGRARSFTLTLHDKAVPDGRGVYVTVSQWRGSTALYVDRGCVTLGRPTRYPVVKGLTYAHVQITGAAAGLQCWMQFATAGTGTVTYH